MTDPDGMQDEVLCDSPYAMRALGGLQIASGAAGLLMGGAYRANAAAAVGLGGVTLALYFIPRFYSFSQAAAILSWWAWGALAAPLFPAASAAVMLAGAALVPLRPLMAALSSTIFIALNAHSETWPAAILAGAVSGLEYARRSRAYGAHLSLVRSSQDLRVAQAKALAADNAASLEQVAAAMAHDMNSPLGALKSSAATIAQVSDKLPTAKGEKLLRLLALQRDVSAALVEAAGRIDETVRRMQRYSRLDRGEIQPVDLNEVLKDAAGLLPAVARSRVTLLLDPLPMVLCEPRAWGCIFTNLLSDATAHSAAVQVTTGFADSRIRVEIRDSRATAASGPTFVAQNGRVASGNWNLFHARQWVRQQGGELRLTSDVQKGRTAEITLSAAAVNSVSARQS